MEKSFEVEMWGCDSSLSPRERESFYTKMKDVVVVIETEYESDSPKPQPSSYPSSYVCEEDDAANNMKVLIGGGVLLNSKGLVLTCAHLIPEKPKLLITLRRVDDDMFWEAKIERRDILSDLCLLSVIDRGIFDFAKFADDIYVGMEVISICHTQRLVYSLLIGEVAFENYRKVGNIINPMVDVDLADFDPQLPVIQMNNLHCGHGASGAPIFDSKGRVIGITSFILKGFSFAVHFSRCTKFLQDYLAAERNKKMKRNKKRKFNNDKRKKGGKMSNSGHQMDLVP